MQLIAEPGIGLASLPGRLEFPAHSRTLIAKVTLALTPDGVARVLRDEATFPCGDQPYAGDAPGSSGAPRYASDFVYHKPSAELAVVGHFYAPAGKLVRAGEAVATIDGRCARLCVIGRRRYHGVGPLPSAREAEPFTRLALRWEHAYGGAGHAQNPLGTGHLSPEEQPHDFVRTPLELPRIERPEHLFTQLGQAPEPACFAPRAAGWPAQRALFGSCDARWLETRWPWLPADFDARYFMTAPRALQQTTYLRGDERLCFENMHPAHARYQTALPGLRAICVVQRVDASCEPLALQLDTLWVDMDNERAQLVFRGSLRCRDAAASDLDSAWVGLVPLALALSPAEVRERGAQAIAADEAYWCALATPEGEPDMIGSDRTAPEVWDAVEARAPSSTWSRQRVRERRLEAGALRAQDMRGLDLSGEDLSGVDLSGALLDGACLDRACLRGAELSDASLRGASLNDTDLSHARLIAADLSRARGKRLRVQGAKLVRANFSACHFPEAVLRDCDLSFVLADRARLNGAYCEGCQFDEASFAGAELDTASFERCSLRGARFVDTALAQAVFTDCALSEADFERADLSQASLLRCSLDDVLLEAAKACGVRLEASSVARLRAEGADLSQSQWHEVEGADLVAVASCFADARLKGCRLHGADLSDADLARASLSGCTLIAAKLAAADLSDARLLGCDCFEASFERARLSRCDGSGSSFFRAEFLDAEVDTFHGCARELAGSKLAAGQG